MTSCVLWIIVCLSISGLSPGKCDYCGKEFAVVGRHVWRCVSQITSAAAGTSIVKPITTISGNQPKLECGLVREIPIVKSSTLTKCICGQLCKGRRGLSMHQRSFKTFADLSLNADPVSDDDNNSTPIPNAANNSDPADVITTLCDKNDECSDSTSKNSRPIKMGIKLPKTKDQWKEASLFFRISLDLLPSVDDISNYASSLQNLVYSYFVSEFGLINSNSELADKYANSSSK
jgi:hypothetical protein